MNDFYRQLEEDEDCVNQLIVDLHGMYVYPYYIIDIACKELASHHPWTMRTTVTFLWLNQPDLCSEFEIILDRLISTEAKKAYRKAYERIFSEKKK